MPLAPDVLKKLRMEEVFPPGQLLEALQKGLLEYHHLRRFRDVLQETGTALYLDNQRLRSKLKEAIAYLESWESDKRADNPWKRNTLLSDLSQMRRAVESPMRLPAGIMRTPMEIRMEILDLFVKLANLKPDDPTYQRLRGRQEAFFWILLDEPDEADFPNGEPA